MPDAAQKPQETPQTGLDQAVAQIEAFVADLEAQHKKAEDLAQVPEDIPRFVTRYEP